MSDKANNKLIVKNTIYLYFKLVLSVIIGLYTSRIVLLALGASDYGIFSVVGGLVVMMNLLGTSMIATTNRFIAVEIGHGKEGNLTKVYNTLFVVHIILALFFILVGESLGMYYVNKFFNVEKTKISDAAFILNASVLASAIHILSVPSQGLIIAREKFLYTSILEIVSLTFKLCLVIWLSCSTGNRLREYALIMASYSLIQSIGYIYYCYYKEPSSVKWQINKTLSDYKPIAAFASWMLVGSIAFVGRIQGAAIIINFYFGTIINAAFGIASQINEYTMMFARNLSQATNPQIMKSGSGGDLTRSLNLVYKISKFTFLILMIIVIPLLLNIDFILKLWLKEPPCQTNTFAMYLLINGLLSCLNSGFDASIQTTGKVRTNQIGYTIINILLLPIIWFLYKIGFSAYICGVIMILLTLVTIIFQCILLSKLTIFTVSEYISKTVKPCAFSLFAALMPLLGLSKIVSRTTIIYQFAFIVICLLWSLLCIYIFGLCKDEKLLLNESIKNLKNKYL